MWLVYSSLIAQFYGLINRDFPQFFPDHCKSSEKPFCSFYLIIYFNPGGPGKRTSVPNSRPRFHPAVKPRGSSPDDGSVLLFSRGFRPLFLVLVHRSRVGGPPGTNVPAVIPDLQDDSRERGDGTGREETLELRENRDRSRATGREELE